MQSNRKITFLLVQSLLVFLSSGCQVPQGPVKVVFPPDPAETQASAGGPTVAKRFQQSAPKAPTVVESAMELSEKYANLSDEVAALRGENQEFIAENSYLKEQLAICEAQLQQAQKELNETNDLLIEMRIELNNWKADILGFRGEMRDAEKTQLEALLKILNILGGEVKAESTQGKDVNSTEPSQAEPSQSQPQSRRPEQL